MSFKEKIKLVNALKSRMATKSSGNIQYFLIRNEMKYSAVSLFGRGLWVDVCGQRSYSGHPPSQSPHGQIHKNHR